MKILLLFFAFASPILGQNNDSFVEDNTIGGDNASDAFGDENWDNSTDAWDDWGMQQDVYVPGAKPTILTEEGNIIFHVEDFEKDVYIELGDERYSLKGMIDGLESNINMLTEQVNEQFMDTDATIDNVMDVIDQNLADTHEMFADAHNDRLDIRHTLEEVIDNRLTELSEELSAVEDELTYNLADSHSNLAEELQAIRACHADGLVYSHEANDCRPAISVSCRKSDLSDMMDALHATFSPDCDQLAYGSAGCLVSCAGGYEGTSSSFTCNHDAEWTGSITCERIQCEEIEDPQNGGQHDCEGDRYGDTCTMSCRDGGDLSGSTERTCQADGSWSGSQGTCVYDWLPRDNGRYYVLKKDNTAIFSNRACNHNWAGTETRRNGVPFRTGPGGGGHMYGMPPGRRFDVPRMQNVKHMHMLAPGGRCSHTNWYVRWYYADGSSWQTCTLHVPHDCGASNGGCGNVGHSGGYRYHQGRYHGSCCDQYYRLRFDNNHRSKTVTGIMVHYSHGTCGGHYHGQAWAATLEF